MRIASLSPAVTEILFALGKEEEIVCCDQFSNFPEIAKEIPKLEGHQKIDLEKLAEFQPDLVFTSTVIQEKLAGEIRKSGFECVHQNPRTLDEVSQTFIDIGVVLDCEAASRQLSEKFRQGMNEVKKRAQKNPRRLRVYIEEWHNPPMVSGNWVPEIIRLAGGEGFRLERGALSREVSLEEVQSFAPEMIILSPCGAGPKAEKVLITGRSGWDQLDAVKQGNIKVIDDSLLNRPGPRLVEGAQRVFGWVFECLH